LGGKTDVQYLTHQQYSFAIALAGKMNASSSAMVT
jgi:hypothetical protein